MKLGCGGAALGGCALGRGEFEWAAGRSREGTRARGGPGRGREGWAFFLFSPIFFIFSSFYYFKSNSLLSSCFTNSLIKQSGKMLRHDATIKAPLEFYFTRLTHRYKQNNSSLFRKRKEKRGKERLTPEFGGY
jgi:hypothetical protein